MQTAIALKRHFPKFLEMLSSLPDYRKSPDYKTEEVLMAVIAIFLSLTQTPVTNCCGNYGQKVLRSYTVYVLETKTVR